jgi:protein-tyrosine phosphatase
MPKSSWWIDEAVLLAGRNPEDAELVRLRECGFGVAVPLLEEEKQPARYDGKAASRAGWWIYSIPVGEGAAPSLKQLADFTKCVQSSQGTKVLVFCDSGLGRSACMGAAYWIAKGSTTSDAVARVKRACAKSDWLTEERRAVLHAWDLHCNGNTMPQRGA